MVWNCSLRTHQRPTTTQHMHAPRRSEKSHKLTAEERSRGGRMRAAKIYTAKSQAMAEGRAYKPLRRRRRSPFGLGGDPYASRPAPAPEREGALPLPPGFDELTDEEVAAEARAFWLDDL